MTIIVMLMMLTILVLAVLVLAVLLLEMFLDLSTFLGDVSGLEVFWVLGFPLGPEFLTLTTNVCHGHLAFLAGLSFGFSSDSSSNFAFAISVSGFPSSDLLWAEWAFALAFFFVVSRSIFVVSMVSMISMIVSIIMTMTFIVTTVRLMISSEF